LIGLRKLRMDAAPSTGDEAPIGAGLAFRQALGGMKLALSIRAHLAILVLATAFPLLALTTYNAGNQAREDTQRARAQTAQAARAVAAETERTLQRAKGLLAHLSGHPMVRSLDRDRCDPLFSKFTGLFPQYTNLLTVNRQGDRVCSALKPPAGAPSTVGPELFLSESLRARSFTIGQAIRGRYSGRWILFAAHTVISEAGEATGAVAVTVDLANLTLAPGLSDLSERTEARIVDANGLILASSVSPQQTIGQRAPRRDDAVDRIVGTAPIAGTTWRAEVEVPTDLVLAPVKQRVKVSAGIALGVLLLSGFTGLPDWASHGTSDRGHRIVGTQRNNGRRVDTGDRSEAARRRAARGAGARHRFCGHVADSNERRGGSARQRAAPLGDVAFDW